MADDLGEGIYRAMVEDNDGMPKLGPAATLHVVEGGDHSFKVPRGGASAQAAVFEDVQHTVAGWMTAVNGRSTPEPRRSA